MNTDRRLNLSDFMHLAVLQKELADAKGWHHILVREARPKASQKQFAYYYAVVLPVAAQWLNESQGGIEERDGEVIDFTTDDADLWLKTDLRGRKVNGTIVPPSKRTWDTRAMVLFVDEVVALLKKNGCRVPPPDPAWREFRQQAMRTEAA